MMPFNEDLDEELVGEVSEAYKKAATWLPFAAADIKAVFSESELAGIKQFQDAMAKATTENEKRAKIIANVAMVAKLLKVAKVI